MSSPAFEDEEPIIFGLVVGLGPAAGLYYYRRLMEATGSRDEPLRLLMAHADLPTVLRFVRGDDVEGLARYLRTFLEALSRAGCSLAAISAVTPHICIRELSAISPVPLLSVLDVLTSALAERRVRRVALFGTRFTIESDLFGALSDYEVIRPTAEETMLIDAAYTDLALRGHGTPEDRETLARIAHTLIGRERLDAIALAGTDLSMLYATEKPEFRAIDVAQLHVNAIVDRLGGTLSS